MAHFQQLQFVEMVARHMAADWAGLRVLEIGSADINGSVRPFFTHSDYTGVDLAAESPGSQSVGWDYYRNLNREDFERRLDLPQLGYGLAATNTLVRPDQPLKFRDRLRAIKDSPLKWAPNLPDPAYQAFVIRWTAAEKAVRQALGDK